MGLELGVGLSVGLTVKIEVLCKATANVHLGMPNAKKMGKPQAGLLGLIGSHVS